MLENFDESLEYEEELVEESEVVDMVEKSDKDSVVEVAALIEIITDAEDEDENLATTALDDVIRAARLVKPELTPPLVVLEYRLNLRLPPHI
jgi:hypothetical protein